jgi:hypothetical protein
MILWMLWPLALWGIILVGLYMAAYQSIDNMSAPLAMLNVVTFVSIRFTRTFYFAQVGCCLCNPCAQRTPLYMLAAQTLGSAC